jgi:hypothetical protein
VTEVAAGAEAGMEGAGDDRVVALLRVTLKRTVRDQDQDRIGVSLGMVKAYQTQMLQLAIP